MVDRRDCTTTIKIPHLGWEEQLSLNRGDSAERDLGPRRSPSFGGVILSGHEHWAAAGLGQTWAPAHRMWPSVLAGGPPALRLLLGFRVGSPLSGKCTRSLPQPYPLHRVGLHQKDRRLTGGCSTHDSRAAQREIHRRLTSNAASPSAADPRRNASSFGLRPGWGAVFPIHHTFLCVPGDLCVRHFGVASLAQFYRQLVNTRPLQWFSNDDLP